MRWVALGTAASAGEAAGDGKLAGAHKDIVTSTSIPGWAMVDV